MSDQEVDLLNPEESDNSLGWFKAVVVEDYFSTPMTESGGKAAAYDNANQWQRYWVLKILDIYQDWEREVPDPMVVTLGIGKKWHPTDDSNTAMKHDEDQGKGPARTFDKKSKMGQLLALMRGDRKAWQAPFGVVVLDGGPDPTEGGEYGYNMKPLLTYLRENELIDPREAGIFNGCVFMFRSLGLKYDAERDVRGKPHPVAFLGVETEHGELSAPAAKAKVETDPQAVANTLSVAGVEYTADDAEAIAKLLDTNKTHRTFARNALTAFPGLKDPIMDEANGPWSVRGT